MKNCFFCVINDGKNYLILKFQDKIEKMAYFTEYPFLPTHIRVGKVPTFFE